MVWIKSLLNVAHRYSIPHQTDTSILDVVKPGRIHSIVDKLNSTPGGAGSGGNEKSDGQVGWFQMPLLFSEDVL